MLDIYQELAIAAQKGERAALATVISAQGSTPRKAGAKMLVKKDGTVVGTIGGGYVEQRAQEKAIEVMNSGEAQIMHFDLSGAEKEPAMICGGNMDIFVEPILPKDTLYLFGAGHVAQSTAPIAKILGFQLIVIDPRSDYNNSHRFPNADSLIVEEYESVFSTLNVVEGSYIVICTTGHVFDEQCLEFSLGTKAKYIGMIGSQKKVKDVRERLEKKGVSPQKLDSVYTPIGLNIGAETPEEIAVSIMAEIIKVRRSLE